MHPVNRSLWLRFINVAQPYFFPTIRGGRWVTLLLMVMLLLFLFGVLSVVATGMIMAGNYFVPVITSEIASGLLSEIRDVLHSDAWLIVAAALFIPAAVFVAFGRHLRKQKQAWFLLALVLTLSLAVTGINVAFSYISNFFTNALVKKKSGHGLFVCCRLFLRISCRDPCGGLLQLRAELSGHAMAGMDDRIFFEQLFQKPQIL